MDNYFYPTVSEETFAAWLDGTLSAEDEILFLEACATNREVQELLDANDQVDESFENLIENGYELPEVLQADFELPDIYDHSDDDIEEYTYDEIEPYDVEPYDEDEDSVISSEDSCYNAEADNGDDYDKNDYDIL